LRLHVLGVPNEAVLESLLIARLDRVEVQPRRYLSASDVAPHHSRARLQRRGIADPEDWSKYGLAESDVRGSAPKRGAAVRG